MKLSMLSCLVVVAAIAMGQPAVAGEKCCFQGDTCCKSQSTVVCPVSGKAVDMSVSAEYGGGEVYFACSGCLKEFEEKTEKYAAKANRQLVATDQAKQVACPLTGRDFDKDKTAEIGGVNVAFCCGGCIGKITQAESADRVNMVFGKGFENGFKIEKKEDKKES